MPPRAKVKSAVAVRTYAVDPEVIAAAAHTFLLSVHNNFPVTEIPDTIKKVGGVYGLFWHGPSDTFLNRTLGVPGPAHKPPIDVEFNRAWVRHPAAVHPKSGVALYVGTTNDLHKRLSQHRAASVAVIRQESTTSQVRKVLQKLFGAHAKSEFEKYVRVRYVANANAAERFFIEQKLIGELLPLFNVKPEH